MQKVCKNGANCVYKYYNPLLKKTKMYSNSALNEVQQLENYSADDSDSDYEYEEDILNTTQESNSSFLKNYDLDEKKIHEEQEMLGLFLNFLRENKLNQTAEKLMEELKSSSKSQYLIIKL